LVLGDPVSKTGEILNFDLLDKGKNNSCFFNGFKIVASFLSS